MDYYSKFPVKGLGGFSTDNIIKMQGYCLEFGLPSEIVPDGGTYFVSENFKLFCSNSAYITQYHCLIITKAMDKQRHT